MKIICPYCFAKMEDDDVHFRSEKVNQGECDIIPDGYSDFDDFQARYTGPDEEKITEQYLEWEFFEEKADDKYENFWARFNGTTEYNIADEALKVKAYNRPVINPIDSKHQKYLKMQPDGTYFIRDAQNMVSQIELKTGEVCDRRVCPFCHNPFPNNYGKNPVKFVTVIGITGSGKTVYLSQLLRKMASYVVKVGLSAIPSTASSVTAFLKNNAVLVNKPLPGSTPRERFQQPLFYEMVKEEEGNKKTETFILYDVAGEIFEDGGLVKKFAPFIQYADGMIMLIDPMQFNVINEVATQTTGLADPTQVLNTIHNIVCGNTDRKCDIPFAVCISKADTKEVQEVFSEELKRRLLDDVEGVKNREGFYMPIFNAGKYAPIARELDRFMKTNEVVLASQLHTNYSSYSYFAFTALGCDVENGTFENGEKYKYPVGPVLPKRLEEPLLWLLYKLGYVGKNAPLPGEPLYCPNCSSNDTSELPKDQQILTVVRKTGVIFKKTTTETYHVDHVCNKCGYKWEQSSN